MNQQPTATEPPIEAILADDAQFLADMELAAMIRAGEALLEAAEADRMAAITVVI